MLLSNFGFCEKRDTFLHIQNNEPTYLATAIDCYKFVLTYVYNMKYLSKWLNSQIGGFVDPGKVQQQQAPPPQQGVPGPAGGAGPGQTVIVQYMNPPNFGHNPVSKFRIV